MLNVSFVSEIVTQFIMIYSLSRVFSLVLRKQDWRHNKSDEMWFSEKVFQKPTAQRRFFSLWRLWMLIAWKFFLSLQQRDRLFASEGYLSRD